MVNRNLFPDLCWGVAQSSQSQGPHCSSPLATGYFVSFSSHTQFSKILSTSSCSAPSYSSTQLIPPASSCVLKPVLLTSPVTNIWLSLPDIFQSLSHQLLCYITGTVEHSPSPPLKPSLPRIAQSSGSHLSLTLFLLCLPRLLFLPLPRF